MQVSAKKRAIKVAYTGQTQPTFDLGLVAAHQINKNGLVSKWVQHPATSCSAACIHDDHVLQDTI
jgi:hypothetical protein